MWILLFCGCVLCFYLFLCGFFFRFCVCLSAVLALSGALSGLKIRFVFRFFVVRCSPFVLALYSLRLLRGLLGVFPFFGVEDRVCIFILLCCLCCVLCFLLCLSLASF